MRFIYLFLFLFCGNLSFGQTYPVQVLVNVPSPYSFYLSDYVSGSQERFIVTLLNRDIQYVSMPVRLKLTVKGNGFSLQSSSYASVPPIVLEPNVPYRLSMEELLPYFDTRNLIGQGLGASGYLKGTRLPEGMLEFTVEVLEYQTNRLLSRQGNAMIFLSLQKPPQLSLPFDGEILSWKEPLHILFQWTPQHSGVARVEYELIIKELWDTGMDPSSAFAFSPEIFRERITTTSYAYGPLCPALEPGHKYAWCVRVIAKDGIDDIRIFENDGLSLIRTFRIGCYCPDPLALQSETKRGNITLTWKGAPEHGEYSIAYRLKGTDNWHEERAYSSPAQLFGIRPGQTYEYKVGGVCFDGGISYTSIQSVTLPSEDTSRQHSCGILPPVDLSNTAPLEELYEGEMFWAGDFPVEVTSATGGSGIFSGEGNISVPYLLFHRFAVRFDNVFINSDRRMVRGFVETVYDESDGSVGNLDNIFEGGAATGEIASGITYADIDLSFTIPDDGNCTYDSLTSQVHVYDGDDEIGVIDLSGLLASSGENTSSVSGESIFPITVKDSDGNLYSLEPETDTPVDSSGNTPLKVRKVGSSGGALPEGSVFYDRLDGEIGLVTFRDVDGSRYEFDTWNPVYSGSLLIRDKYERLDRDYYVPCKLLPSGASDRVVAHLEIRGSDVDPNKIKFLTRQGTEYVPESFNAESGDYILSLVGGKENDGQELYALYPKPDSGYYNLGKLLILSYPSYSFPVKIVSVGGGLPAEEFSALRQNLENLFSRYGIRCDVSYDETVYSDLQMFDKGSGLLSAYNSRMKAFHHHYASTHEMDEGCSYLFVFPESGNKRNRDFSGFMPRNCQFGYVFRQDFTGFDSFCLAVAHELCHGRLSLKHIFDNSYGLSEGDLAENLMDYRDGSHLAKWQWDLIHDPGVVVRIFERDKDVAIQPKQDTIEGHAKIVMYNDEKEFKEDSYQLISALPSMPKLSFKAVGNKTKGKVKFQLKIEYKRDNRSDEDYFPSKDKFAEVDSIWEVDWQNKIRGGKATLLCHTDNSKDTLIFYIRGTNPTEQEIKNFLLQQNYLDVWFLTRLIRQESEYRQFNPGTKYGPTWESLAGCPNWGTPHGWGLMQLDVLNSSCGELNKDGKYRPSAEALWNWKENLKKGYAFLTGEKKGIINNQIIVYEKKLDKWYEKNSADSVVGYSNQIEGRITFMHASSPHFNFDWGVLDSGVRSFMEAMWIKSYNGNSRGHYYELVDSDDEESRPYWRLNRLNSNNHNYVEAVCKQSE